MMKMWLSAVSVLLLCAVSACSSLRPKAPEVSLESIRFVEVGLVDQKFTLLLRVQNPNSQDYVVTGLSYEAEVGGKSFVKGVSNQRVVLAAFAESLIEVPANARLAHLFNGLLGGLDALIVGKTDGRELEYRIHGTVQIEGLGALPFDRKGKVTPGGQKKVPPPPVDAGRA